jgi:hypothetical protein
MSSDAAHPSPGDETRHEPRGAQPDSHATDDPMGEGHGAVPIRSMHDVLSNWWRRAVLYYLRQHAPPVGVRTMTRQLVAWHCGDRFTTCLAPDAALVAPTRRYLRSAHVVPMAEFGVLGYDPAVETVWLPETVTVSVAPPW